jgi:hypothetical protein
MSKVIYEVTFSDTNTHSVCVKSDDPLALQDALPLAKQLQAELSQESGHPESGTPAPKQSPLPSIDVQSQAPQCGIHSTAMTQVQGKHGLFWSCHQKNFDGSWCSYRPARSNSSAPAYGMAAG